MTTETNTLPPMPEVYKACIAQMIEMVDSGRIEKENSSVLLLGIAVTLTVIYGTCPSMSVIIPASGRNAYDEYKEKT